MNAAVCILLMLAGVAMANPATPAPAAAGAPAAGKPPKQFKCLFFPGEGLDWPQLDVELKDRAKHDKFVKKSFDDYWGKDVVKHVTEGQRCDKVVFYDTDTSYRGWRAKSIAEEFHNALKEVQPNVVFAHSMGNLVLAACAKRKLPNCQKLGKSIDWYGINAPLRGTDVRKVLKPLCPQLSAVKGFGSGVECVQRNDTRGAPIPGKFDVAAVYDSLKTSEVPSWVAGIASEKMRGSLCGVVASDYLKPAKDADATAFGAIAKAMAAKKGQKKDVTSDWKARNTANTRVPEFGNDGIVPFSSCKVDGGKRYEKKPTHRFYVVDGDHDYGTCSNGEVPKSGSREPCSWIANMVRKSRRTAGLPERFMQVDAEEETAAEVVIAGEDEDEAESEIDAAADAEDEDESEDEDEAEEEEEDSAEDEDEVDEDADEEVDEDADEEVEEDAEDELEAEDEAEEEAEDA